MSVPYTYILVEQDGQQGKIPYTEFANNFIQYVPEPISSETDGQQGQMAVDNWDIISGGESISSSAFVYSNNAWRKIPTYTTNWDDIEPVDNEDGTFTYLRFLPIHKEIALTKKELDNVHKTLDITVATNTKLGLVRGTSDFSEHFGTITVEKDGSLKVASATNTYQGTVQLFDEYGDELGKVQPIVYTKQAIDRKFTKAGALTIPTADRNTLGGIRVGPNMNISGEGVLSIATAVIQETNIPLGLVRYAPMSFTDSQNIGNEDYIKDESSYTLSLGQSRALIKHYVDKIGEQPKFELKPANAVTLGGVLVDSNNTNIQIDGKGLIEVKDATEDRAGAVKYLTSFDDINNLTEGVPTIYTIKQYVDSKVSQNLPVATTTTAGAIIVGQGLKVNSDGVVDVNLPLATIDQKGLVYTTQTITEENKSHAYVPTSECVYNFVTSLIEQPETPLIPSATSTKAGAVIVQPAATDVKENNTYKVPTVQYVRDHVSDAIESTLSEAEVVRSEQWLVVGTGTFDVDTLKQTALANQEILVSAITSSSTQDQAFILPAGLNILVFQNSITAEKLNIILSGLSLEIGTYQNSCANNFILIPGERIFGYYLQNGLVQQ